MERHVRPTSPPAVEQATLNVFRAVHACLQTLLTPLTESRGKCTVGMHTQSCCTTLPFGVISFRRAPNHFNQLKPLGKTNAQLFNKQLNPKKNRSSITWAFLTASQKLFQHPLNQLYPVEEVVPATAFIVQLQG